MSLHEHNHGSLSERCHSRPIYPLRVTSSGASRWEDYPHPDLETEHRRNAPIFQGGLPLSKSALTSEDPSMRAESPSKYQRISRPVPMMRTEYDVVVVGSGYGGAVAASRMARAGKKVCILELGKERWPGEYPNDLESCSKDVHVTGQLEKSKLLANLDSGDPQGLYHLIMGDGQHAFVGNGLGGTSLLNANVFLPATHRTLSQPAFPPEIRDDPSDLDEYYDLAAEVLQPEPYPENFPKLHKLTVLEEQAKILGPEYHDRFYRVPQTTTFKNRINSMGVHQQKSTLSGQDATGVNDGSKNSTLMNYLPDAWNHGAEIFCGCEVRYIKQCTKGPNKWTVYFAWHGDKRGQFKDELYTDLMWVQAKEFVFLGAGTFGTTEILLRSEARGLKLSSELGTNMSGNGDVLAFAHNSDKVVNGIGTENSAYLAHSPVGPTINGIIDMRDEEVAPNVFDGYVIEEGAIPSALAKVVEKMFAATPDCKSPQHESAHNHVDHGIAKLKSKLGGPWRHRSSLNCTMVYLIMSHDDNQAILTLRNDAPHLQFMGVARSEHVDRITGILQKAANGIDAKYIPNPFTSKLLGKSEITVHPIGGANMSSDGTGKSGVTNHIGQVFKGESKDVYDGLVVVDGSVIPSALGVNPFATITALAERSVRAVAWEKGIVIDYDSKNGVIDWGRPKVTWPLTKDMKQATVEISNSPKTGGARFTELMEGYVNIGDDIEDFQTAYEAAKGVDSGAKFYLSCDVWDIGALKSRHNHAAMLTGTFCCRELSRDPLMILRGDFQLFTTDHDTADTKNLVYDFDMVSTENETFHFHGYKIIDPTIAGSISKTWKATTTLFVVLTRPSGSIVGRGVLHMSKKNFRDELWTLNGIHGSKLNKLFCVAEYAKFFMKRLNGSAITVMTPLKFPTENTDHFKTNVPLKTITITAEDGVETTLCMWNREETPKMPILLAGGAAVDHQVFALPTIEFNFVDFLVAHGYTVYCINHRVGKTPVAKQNWTTYDARLDIAAATKYIIDTTKAREIYAIVHCAGAIAMAAGLLDGTIKGIGGLTASQVFMNPVFAEVNMFKAKFRPSLPSVYEDLIGDWFECSQDGKDDAFLDQALRFYPVGGKQELCRSLVCHRSELVMGRLWSHPNLNDLTHKNLGMFVGGISMKNLKQLQFMGSHGQVVDNEYKNLVTDENLKRLHHIPISLIHGEDNTVYDPVSTDRDLQMLLDRFKDSAHYKRKLFPDKGHLDCWMGSKSYIDVYRWVEERARETITERGLYAHVEDGSWKG